MKNQDLTTIYQYLATEDAHFYDLQTGGESVSGFFEYVIERRPDEDVLGAVAFCVDIDDLLNAACACRYITDYENTRSGLTVYEAGHFGDDIAIPVEDWAVNMVADHNAAIQEILRDAVRRIFTARVESMAVEIAAGAASCSIVQRIRRDVDTAFCDAVEALAEIIRTVNQEKQAA